MGQQYEKLENLSVHLVPETELTTVDDARIRTLLVAAFPQHAAIFTRVSYWGARAEYRLWLETADGRMIAHLGFGPRVVSVGDREVLIAGVGEVATHPDVQGRGAGRRMMDELQDILRRQVPVAFGYLSCREEVTGFYTRVGWHRIAQPYRYLDPDAPDATWRSDPGPSLILSASEPVENWPIEGIVDLRGMPW